MTESAETTTELVLQKRQKDLAFADIESFDDAWAIVQSAFDNVETASSLGDGFALVEKNTLVGVPMLLMHWQFQESDMSDLPFVVVRAITRESRKVVFIDGGTGIRDQLLEYSTRRDGRNGGLLAEHGLRDSTYTVTPDSGKPFQATTYYVDTSM